MNKFKSYIIGAMAMLAIGGGLVSCQNHFDEPTVGEGPVATMTPNTTIAELKEWMWSNDLNYCDTVYTRDYFTGQTSDPWEGEHVIVSGRVISSDYAGNCFKYIVLQDATGALNFSINSYNLYLDYRRGQEIVVDLTGLFAGKYRGLFQVGFPSFNSSSNGYETSFLAPEMFRSHRELNGMPQIEDIDTILISSFSELGASPSELRKWQSQLIRINNVTFSQSSEAAAEGITTLSTYHSSGVSQTITDSQGNTGAVRTSGYANFWNMELPEGNVDVVLLASYYGSNESNAAWQFTLIDAEGIILDPTVPKGSKDNPYSIGEAIELQSGSSVTTGWVEGYLVGTVGPEVTEVNSNDDVEWGQDPTLGNTMVIAPTFDCTDVTKCLVIELPQSSAIAKQSIRENPSNYGKEIAIRGSFESVMGTFGVVTPGSTNDYMIEGQGGDVVVPEGVYTVFQALEMINSNNIPSEAVKVQGIISSIKEVDTSYGNATYYIVDKLGDSNNLTIYRGYWFNGAKFTSADQIKEGDLVIVEGTLINYYGNTPEMEQGNKIISINGDDGTGSGGDTPSTPGTGDFSETFKSSQGGFTIENVSLPSALTYVWLHDASYGYMKASAFANNTSYASDSWLISPMLSVSSSSVLTFEHVTNKFTSLDVAKQQVSVAVREDGGSWQTVTVPNWSTNNDWVFVNSGNISLSAFAGKKVQIGFHYTSADGSSGSWEIKNLVVTNASQVSGGNTGGGTTNPDQGTETPTTPGGTVVAYVADGAAYTGSGDVVTLTGTVADKSYTATDVCTLKFNKVNASDSNVNGGQVRWYKNDGITITPAAGVTITGVKINSVTNYTAENHIIPSTGWTYEGLVATWSGSATSAFKFSNDNQIRFTYIEITYSK